MKVLPEKVDVLVIGGGVSGAAAAIAASRAGADTMLIERNAFIGGMSLVTKNVPENTCVVGIPAKNWRRQK